MKIRLAAKTDFDAIVRINRSIFPPDGSDPSDGYRWAIDHATVLVADDGDEVIGFGILREGAKASIDELYILEEHRGDGIGSSMLEGLENQAREKGIKSLNIHANSPNPQDFERLVEFYSKRGYSQLQVSPGAWVDFEKEL